MSREALLLPAFLFYIVNRIDDTAKANKNIFMFCSICVLRCTNITNDLDCVAGIYTIPEPGIVIIEILSLFSSFFCPYTIPFF
jgi:hypothetical protein